jgi:hypothetical protein
MREAASRTFWTAGSKMPMRMAMMAMTTRSSISVKALQSLDLREGGAYLRLSCLTLLLRVRLECLAYPQQREGTPKYLSA